MPLTVCLLVHHIDHTDSSATLAEAVLDSIGEEVLKRTRDIAPYAESHDQRRILFTAQQREDACLNEGGLADTTAAIEGNDEIVVDETCHIVALSIASAKQKLTFADGRIFVGSKSCPWIL